MHYNKKHKHIYAAGKEEIQAVNQRHDELGSDLWALMDHQHIEYAIEQSRKAGNEEIKQLHTERKRHGNHNADSRNGTGQYEDKDKLLQVEKLRLFHDLTSIFLV